MIRITTLTNAPIRRIKAKSGYSGIDKDAPENQIKRLRALLRDAATPEKGTELGLMVFRGQLTDDEYAACRWFDKLQTKYHRAIDAKGVKTASLSPGDKAEPADPFSEIGAARARAERATVAEYDSAALAGLACGSENWGLFRRVVVEGVAPTSISAAAVKVVATALNSHRRKSSRFRRGRRAR